MELKNDECALVDALGRGGLTKGLTRIAELAETPMTVGIYGPWGSGKSTLMRLVQSELEERDYKTVWFNAWQHQYDERPALALVQKLLVDLGLSDRAHFKKLFKLILLGLLSPVQKLGLTYSEIQKLAKDAETESHLQIDPGVQLRRHFQELLQCAVDDIRKKDNTTEPRLLLFIDDLDRCLPDSILEILEALKLYFNHPGCICFLAVDRKAIEASIRLRYEKQPGFSAAQYLDKIVQLPFEVPLIDKKEMLSFTKSLLPASLKGAAPLLEKGLDRNPRAVKRFANLLQLCAYVWSGDTRPPIVSEVMALVLLIQSSNTALYRALAEEPNRLKQLCSSEDGDVAIPDVDGNSIELSLHVERLLDIAKSALLQVGDEVLPQYFYLTATLMGESEFPETVVDEKSGADADSDIVIDPEDFIDPKLFGRLPQITGRFLPQAEITGVFLLFSTRKQRTWLLRTSDEIAILLDDANTRAKKRVVQWVMRLDQAHPVTVSSSRTIQAGRVHIGARRNWLYSYSLHPRRDAFIDRLNKFIGGQGEGFGLAEGTTQ